MGKQQIVKRYVRGVSIRRKLAVRYYPSHCVKNSVRTVALFSRWTCSSCFQCCSTPEWFSGFDFKYKVQVPGAALFSFGHLDFSCRSLMTSCFPFLLLLTWLFTPYLRTVMNFQTAVRSSREECCWLNLGPWWLVTPLPEVCACWMTVVSWRISRNSRR